MKILLMLKTLLVVACLSTAQAQLQATLELGKRNYVVGEAIDAKVTITNYAGTKLELQGDKRIDWLDFQIKHTNGDAVSMIRRPMYGKLILPTAGTMGKVVDLSTIFMLNQGGNFVVNAVVRIPGQEEFEGIRTNRITFNVVPASVFWRQRVGLNDKAGIREYRLMYHHNENARQLYFQLADGKTEQLLRTYNLGDVLSLREPTAAVDRLQRLNLLYLATPSIWVYVIIDKSGKLVSRAFHKRGAYGEPQLQSMPNGEVLIANSVVYDPVQAQKERNEIPKMSDRPE